MNGFVISSLDLVSKIFTAQASSFVDSLVSGWLPSGGNTTGYPPGNDGHRCTEHTNYSYPDHRYEYLYNSSYCLPSWVYAGIRFAGQSNS
jgi:hypothetical protein